MVAMKIGWLILEVVFLVFFAWFGSSAALALAVLLVIIPVCTLPVNLHIRRRLRVRICAPQNVRKGEDASFSVILVNPTVFPVMRVHYQILAENQLNGEKQILNIRTWVWSGRQQKSEQCMGSLWCGRFRISVQQMTLYDCFGLIGVGCKCNAVTHTTVQPDTFEMGITLLPNPNSIEDSEVYSQERPGSDLTETYQIREYVPGDSPRQIHWKLSGKFDKLIVRDPALPITRNVLVFWERTGETGDPGLIDAQAETVVSLCRSLLDSGIQFSVGWNDTDRNRCVLHEIHDMDELVGIIPRLMRATGCEAGISGAGLLMQTSPEALCGHMVYLAQTPRSEVMEMQRFGNVTMLLCGQNLIDGAIVFDAAHYREQLSQIAL